MRKLALNAPWTVIIAVYLAVVFGAVDALAEDDLGSSSRWGVSTSQSGSRVEVEAAIWGAKHNVSAVAPPRVSNDLLPGQPPEPAPSSVRPWRLPFAYPSGPASGGVDPGVVVEVGTRVAAGVEVPGARFVMQPDPGRNEWNGLPVGFPVWLHVEHPAPIRVQVSDSGVVVDLRAYPVAAVFDTGDGQRYRCVATTVRRLDEDPRVKSPTCHHRFLEKGEYVISAWVEWRVDWSALGQSGSLRLVSEPDRYGLTVIELRSVVVR